MQILISTQPKKGELAGQWKTTQQVMKTKTFVVQFYLSTRTRGFYFIF
jgi:hypothetical protein